MKGEHQDADRNTDIGHVEDAGTEGTDTKIQEIDNTTVMHGAVEEIANPSAQDETPGNGRGQWHPLRKENDRQGQEPGST